MEKSNTKNLRLYVGLAIWAIVLCGMVSLWITESVLILNGRKNVTKLFTRLVQVNTILETMMMNEIRNTSSETELHLDKEFHPPIKGIKDT